MKILSSKNIFEPKKALFLCSKSGTNYISRWNKDKKHAHLSSGTTKKLVPLFDPSRSTPKMPIKLIKSKLYNFSGTKGTSGTINLRNMWVLGNRVYFYKSKGLYKKVRSFCSTVPLRKKNFSHNAKMIQNDTQDIDTIRVEIESA